MRKKNFSFDRDISETSVAISNCDKIPSEIEHAPCFKILVNCFTYTAFAVHTIYTIFSVYTVYTAYIDSTAHNASASPPVVTYLPSVPIAVLLSELLSFCMNGWMGSIFIWNYINARMKILKLCKLKIK